MESPVVSIKLNGDVTDKYYVIEIINDPTSNIEYTIEKYKSIPTYKEDISVIIDKEGSCKKIYTILAVDYNNTSKDGFLISANNPKYHLLQKQNSNNLFFLIKYSTYSEKPKTNNFSWKLNWNLTNYYLSITFENLMYKYFTNVNSIEYKIGVYLQSRTSFQDLNSFIISNDLQPIISQTENETTTSYNTTVFYSTDNINLNEDLYIRIFAESKTTKGEELMFLYEVTEVPAYNKSELYNLIINICLFLGSIILIVVLIIVIRNCKLKEKNSNAKAKHDNKQENIYDLQEGIIN